MSSATDDVILVGHDVRDLLNELFPKIKAGIDYQYEQAEKRGRRLPGVVRRVAEQTLWELVKSGLLRTPEDAAVIAAARAWEAAGDEEDQAVLDAVDIDLSHAVKKLPPVLAEPSNG